MKISLKERIFIADALKKAQGEKAVVAGWIHSIRIVGGVAFIVLRDRTGLIQCVVKKDQNQEGYNLAKDLGSEDVVAIKGTLKESKSSLGGKEINIEAMEVLSRSEKPVPIDPEDWEKTNLATRLDWRFLDLRATRNRLIFEITDAAINAMRDFYRNNGFIEVFTPKIVAEATEGGAEVFPVVYFDRYAYLAQSPQLYKQMMVVAGFERVFEVGPVYRAEKHHTNRHLTEYESVDIEMGFIEDHEDVMKMVEKAVIHTIQAVSQRFGKEIEQYFKIRLDSPKDVPRITFREAHKLLNEHGVKQPDPNDIDSEGEKALGDIVEKEYGSQLFYVTEYPWVKRPFYTMRKENDADYTKSFDLIYRGMEIVSGSQREHRADILEKQIREKGLKVENFNFFIKVFRYGAPPHGGSGLGLERLVAQMLGIKNIREARLLPRDPERLTP
ncbi:MAG: aspartate--tRNA(Asn) ligase [Fervidicoccaceae archaeon]